MDDTQITCKHCGALNTPLRLGKAPNNSKSETVPCGCQKPEKPVPTINGFKPEVSVW